MELSSEGTVLTTLGSLSTALPAHTYVTQFVFTYHAPVERSVETRNVLITVKLNGVAIPVPARVTIPSGLL